jgi:hypothetical protein
MKNILAGTGCALALASLMISYPQASVQAPIFEKSPQVIQGASRTWGSAAADLDGDGDLDIVLAALVSGPLVLINDGNGRFRASDQTMDTEMHDIAIGDLDRDGDLDVFLPNRETGKHEIWFNRLKERAADEKS